MFDDEVRGPGLDLAVHREALPAADADDLFAALRAEVPWRQDDIIVFGQRSPVPRLQAWFGDPGADYGYSGIALSTQPWTAPLLAVRAVAERLAGTTFTSVLANLYRDGGDGVAWHADDEPELGPQPVIASVSLGATRRFQLRRRDDPAQRCELELHHGDVVVMAGATQQRWVHRVPKTSAPVGERINLTFRCVDVAGGRG